MTSFHGQPTRRLTSEFLTVDVLENAGPRIVRLSFRNSPNLFAELPDVSVPTELGDYHFWGGHRLWHAPEAMPRTYIPDDDGLTLTELPDGVALEGKTEGRTGIRKRIEIRLPANSRPVVTLVHTLTNHGAWTVELAPWSITQLHLGGIVIAPLPAENSDPHGLLPNRQFSFWSYTRMRDARLHWDDDFLLFKAEAALPPFKAGYFNRHGWLAYWVDGILFRKSFDLHPGEAHPDGNCNAEIYCNDQFVELESLAPLTRISPGEQVQLSEFWELYDNLAQPFLDGVVARVSALA
jgi:hypothetical protein